MRPRLPRKTLAEKLAAARGEEERWAVIEEHKAEAGRPAVTLDDLKRLRAAVDAADDSVVVTRNALEVAEAGARPALSVLARARDCRQTAIYAVVRPELSRLMQDAEKLTKELGEARSKLKYVSDNLTDPYSEDRRQVARYLRKDMAELFPAEFGLRAEPSAAWAAWEGFAEAIAKEADASFPN
jgi:hypothetical protein